jgi:hypothetical protein
MMPKARQMILRLAFAGLATGACAAAAPRAANAAPLSPASLNAAATPLEKADWVPRCWWRQGLWGPQQVCQQVWAQPQYYGYGGGYGGRGDWDYGRGHHEHREHNEDDER